MQYYRGALEKMDALLLGLLISEEQRLDPMETPSQSLARSTI
jgi:hypothetical protein